MTEVWAVTQWEATTAERAIYSVIPDMVYWTEEEARHKAIDLTTDMALERIDREIKVRAADRLSLSSWSGHNRLADLLIAIYYELSGLFPDLNHINALVGKAEPHIRLIATQLLSLPMDNPRTVKEAVAVAWLVHQRPPFDVIKLTIQQRRTK